VRTVVDLRNDDERAPDVAPRPPGLTTLHLPLDCWEDREFWDVWAAGPQFGTPLYYRAHLERHPERTARVVRAIAAAPEAAGGGVAFHCVGGRDRTGQVAMVALALAGVPAAEVGADYALTPADPEIEAYLRSRGVAAAAVVAELVDSLDFPSLLGLDGATVAAVRARFA
jgi:hypothetical protein